MGARRSSVGLVLVVGMALGVGSCQGTTTTTVSVSAPANQHLLAFAGTGRGVVLVTPSAATVVAGPGAAATSMGSTGPTGSSGSTSSTRAIGGSVDGQGQPWLVYPDGAIASPGGAPHPASQASAALATSVDSAGATRVMRPDPWGTAVVDGSTALVPTLDSTASTFWHAEDSVVHQVSAAGSSVVAGSTDPNAKAVSSIPTGISVPATSVRIERVQALVPLAPNSFVLIMNAPTGADKATSSRLQAAWVRNGAIRRLHLPDLCAGQFQVRASRVDERQIVLSAPAPNAQKECTGDTNLWTELDVVAGLSTPLGSGRGLAAMDGPKLVTVTRAQPSSDTVTMAWQDPPAS